MAINLGATPINKIFLGGTEIKKAYHGATLIHDKTVSGPAPFDPSDLNPLAWFDFSDLSTLFQDAGGTTPVTTHGHGISRFLDKGSAGWHQTEAGPWDGSVWRDAGEIELKRGNSSFAGGSPSGVDDFEIVMGLRNTSSNWMGLGWVQGGTGIVRALNDFFPVLNDGTNWEEGNYGSSSILNGSGAVLGVTRQRGTAGGFRSWVNGSPVHTANARDSQVMIGNFRFVVHEFGGGPAADGDAVMWCAQFFVFDRVISSGERADLVAWVAAKMGLEL